MIIERGQSPTTDIKAVTLFIIESTSVAGLMCMNLHCSMLSIKIHKIWFANASVKSFAKISYHGHRCDLTMYVIGIPNRIIQ